MAVRAGVSAPFGTVSHAKGAETKETVEKIEDATPGGRKGLPEIWGLV
jgi:hypothetical protein